MQHRSYKGSTDHVLCGTIRICCYVALYDEFDALTGGIPDMMAHDLAFL